MGENSVRYTASVASTRSRRTKGLSRKDFPKVVYQYDYIQREIFGLYQPFVSLKVTGFN